MDVTQAELIHANSKDIDSIFKLHYANNPIKSEILASPKKPSAFDFDSLFQDDKLVPTPSVEVTDAAEAVAVTTVPTKADKYSKRQSMKAGSVGTGDGSNSKRHTIQFLGRLNMSSSVNNLSEKPSGKNGLAAAASLGIANEATRKRISQLQTMIAMEEKYATGAMAIISAATNENQKALAMQQLDLFHRNIDKWKVELDQLVAEHHSSQATLADQMKSVKSK